MVSMDGIVERSQRSCLFSSALISFSRKKEEERLFPKFCFPIGHTFSTNMNGCVLSYVFSFFSFFLRTNISAGKSCELLVWFEVTMFLKPVPHFTPIINYSSQISFFFLLEYSSLFSPIYVSLN